MHALNACVIHPTIVPRLYRISLLPDIGLSEHVIYIIVLVAPHAAWRSSVSRASASAAHLQGGAPHGCSTATLDDVMQTGTRCNSCTRYVVTVGNLQHRIYILHWIELRLHPPPAAHHTNPAKMHGAREAENPISCVAVDASHASRDASCCWHPMRRTVSWRSLST